jgi:radical SAM protein with 4Fe4S-binding SPASM domain
MDNLKTVVDEYDFGRLHNWGGQMESKKRRLRKPCTRVWRTFTILWNGDVALCCLDFEGEVKLGNMNQASMTGIWKSPGYAKVRNYHRAGSQHQVPICRKCSKSFLW